MKLGTLECVVCLELLCDVMNALDEDFVPGPKLADLDNRFYELTGLHRGDEL